MHIPASGNVPEFTCSTIGAFLPLNIDHYQSPGKSSVDNYLCEIGIPILDKNLIDKLCESHVFYSYLCIDNIDETKYTRVYLTWFNVSFA